MNLPQNASKWQKDIVLQYMPQFWRKTVFVNIDPLLQICSKKMFKQIQIFLRICPFSNMVRKINFLSISVLLSEIVNFMFKKKTSLWISPKMLQNNRKAQFSSIWLTLWRKKKFLLIFNLYYWFFLKKLFTQIQIFLRICPFSNMVKKQTSKYFRARF